MWKELKTGFLMMLVMTVLTGAIYPAVITALSQVLFRDQANGSLITVNGQVVGSRLIGQNFTKPEYFHPRPSSAGSGYDPTASAGSNLGPTSAKLLNGTTKMDDKEKEVVDFDGIKDRIVHYCVDNDIPYDSSVPLDDVQGCSGQPRRCEADQGVQRRQGAAGLHAEDADPCRRRHGARPQVSIRTSARGTRDLQAARVAKARGVALIRCSAWSHNTPRGATWVSSASRTSTSWSSTWRWISNSRASDERRLLEGTSRRR